MRLDRVSIIGSSNDSVVLTLDTTWDAKHSQHILLVDRFRSLLLSFHTYLFAYLVITGATFKFDESSGISRVSENQKSKTVFIFDLFLHINKLLQSSRVVTIFANLTQAGRCMHFFSEIFFSTAEDSSQRVRSRWAANVNCRIKCPKSNFNALVDPLWYQFACGLKETFRWTSEDIGGGKAKRGKEIHES